MNNLFAFVNHRVAKRFKCVLHRLGIWCLNVNDRCFERFTLGIQCKAVDHTAILCANNYRPNKKYIELHIFIWLGLDDFITYRLSKTMSISRSSEIFAIQSTHGLFHILVCAPFLMPHECHHTLVSIQLESKQTFQIHKNTYLQNCCNHLCNEHHTSSFRRVVHFPNDLTKSYINSWHWMHFFLGGGEGILVFAEQYSVHDCKTPIKGTRFKFPVIRLSSLHCSKTMNKNCTISGTAWLFSTAWISTDKEGLLSHPP